MTFIIDSYSESNSDGDSTEKSVFPTSTTCAHGQTFQCAVRATLRTMRFYIAKVGLPIGHLKARLYAHTGVYGTSGVPNGVALAVSQPINIADLSTTHALVTFTFNDGYVMAPNYYCACMMVEDATLIDVSNYVIIGRDGSAPTHAGNSFYSNTGVWTAYPAYDRVFYVNGDPVIVNLNVAALNVTSLNISRLWG